MRRIGFALLVGLASCQIPSQVAMEGTGGRTSYNMAIQTTNSQQMLLNLVRLRYVDIPLFLDVSGVTTQSTFKSRLSPTLTIPGFNEENPFVLGGELMWQDMPTISYTPLEGQAFSARMMRPVCLHTIQQLVYSGWEIDRIFRIMIQNFDDLYNAPEASGPLPEHVPKLQSFNEAVEILRYYQARGELQIGVQVEPNSVDEKDGIGQRELSLQIAIPADGAKTKRFLELAPNAMKLNDLVVVNMELGFNHKGKIGLMPRSILSCMYYLSQNIQIPETDLDCGYAGCSKDDVGDAIDWSPVLGPLFRVHSSYLPPKNAYVAVKYRKHWYYIDDCDLTSKKTFVLLLQLYNLHAEERKMVGPILTLPLG